MSILTLCLIVGACTFVIVLICRLRCIIVGRRRKRRAEKIRRVQELVERRIHAETFMENLHAARRLRNEQVRRKKSQRAQVGVGVQMEGCKAASPAREQVSGSTSVDTTPTRSVAENAYTTEQSLDDFIRELEMTSARSHKQLDGSGSLELDLALLCAPAPAARSSPLSPATEKSLSDFIDRMERSRNSSPAASAVTSIVPPMDPLPPTEAQLSLLADQQEQSRAQYMSRVSRARAAKERERLAGMDPTAAPAARPAPAPRTPAAGTAPTEGAAPQEGKAPAECAAPAASSFPNDGSGGCPIQRGLVKQRSAAFTAGSVTAPPLAATKDHYFDVAAQPEGIAVPSGPRGSRRPSPNRRHRVRVKSPPGAKAAPRAASRGTNAVVIDDDEEDELTRV